MADAFESLDKIEKAKIFSHLFYFQAILLFDKIILLLYKQFDKQCIIRNNYDRSIVIKCPCVKIM